MLGVSRLCQVKQLEGKGEKGKHKHANKDLLGKPEGKKIIIMGVGSDKLTPLQNLSPSHVFQLDSGTYSVKAGP